MEIETSASSLPTQDATLKFSSIQFPMGIRHYIPLDEDKRISLHLGYPLEIVSDFSVDYEVSANIAGTRDAAAFFVGAGFQYKKFSFEGRVDLNNATITENAPSFQDSKFKRFTLTLAYNIL